MTTIIGIPVTRDSANTLRAEVRRDGVMLSLAAFDVRSRAVAYLDIYDTTGAELDCLLNIPARGSSEREAIEALERKVARLGGLASLVESISGEMSR